MKSVIELRIHFQEGDRVGWAVLQFPCDFSVLTPGTRGDVAVLLPGLNRESIAHSVVDSFVELQAGEAVQIVRIGPTDFRPPSDVATAVALVEFYQKHQRGRLVDAVPWFRSLLTGFDESPASGAASGNRRDFVIPAEEPERVKSGVAGQSVNPAGDRGLGWVAEAYRRRPDFAVPDSQGETFDGGNVGPLLKLNPVAESIGRLTEMLATELPCLTATLLNSLPAMVEQTIGRFHPAGRLLGIDQAEDWTDDAEVGAGAVAEALKRLIDAETDSVKITIGKDAGELRVWLSVVSWWTDGKSAEFRGPSLVEAVGAALVAKWGQERRRKA